MSSIDTYTRAAIAMFGYCVQMLYIYIYDGCSEYVPRTRAVNVRTDTSARGAITRSCRAASSKYVPSSHSTLLLVCTDYVDHNTLYPTIARLLIQVFYLYKDLSGSYDSCFTRLTSTACSVINHLRVLYDKPETYAGSPMFIINALILASSVLLRLLKSSMGSKIDGEKAKTALFAGLNLMKYMILDAKDIASKCSTALNQLWNSPKAFRKADGSEYATLRIRSRLVISPVIDMACWWREEYEPDAPPLAPPNNEDAGSNEVSNSNNYHNSNDDLLLAPISNMANVGSEFGFLNDEFLTDFEWALDSNGGSDYLLPPEAYSDLAWPGATGSADLNLPPI